MSTKQTEHKEKEQKSEQKQDGGEITDAPACIKGELCPVCNQKTLELCESEREIPYFGLLHIFSMNCENPDCNYHKSDIEGEKEENPKKLIFNIESEEDMKVRVVKSSYATIKLPHIATVESMATSNGYVTNIEGILNRIKKQSEILRDTAEDEEERNKAKNIIKKLQKIMWGQESCKLTIEDESGQSAIISDKTVIEPLKVSKKKKE
ncbi:MAG: ZPR1 zinc finger domain-containing protein [Candidatus Woesearchaeota archaeon]|jgi:zinc finger protein